jgi:hypothetical protein
MAAPDPFIVSRLREHPLFARLSPDQLDALAGQCQIVQFAAGSLMFAQGQPTQGAMLFVTGRAIRTQTLPDGREDVIGQVRVRELAGGWQALLEDGIEPANVRVVEQTTAIFISRRKFQYLLGIMPALRQNLMLHDAQPAYTPPPAQGYTDSPAPRFTPMAAPAAAPGAPAVPVASRPAPETAPPVRKTRLKGQRPDETLLHMFRPHWWSLVRYIWIPLLVLLVSGIGGALLAALNPWIGVTVIGIGIIITGLIGLYGYTEWRDDGLFITDQRVIRVRSYILTFRTQIAEMPLIRVTGVTWSEPPLDPMARLFGYGDVIVQTTSEASNVSMGYVQNPARVQQTIFSVRDQVTAQREQSSEQALREEVARALGMGGAPAVPTAQAAPNHDDAVTLPPEGPFFARTRVMGKAGEIIYRHHWSVWLTHILVPGLIFVAVVIVGSVLLAAQQTIPSGLVLTIMAISLLIAGLWMYWADWDWRNDKLIVSNDTITFIHQRPLWLENQVDRVRMAQVDNVISDVQGIVNTLLNRGNVQISLVGSDQNKRFNLVGDPLEIQMEISRRQALIKRQSERGQVESQQEAALQMLAAYYQLTQGAQNTQAAPPVNFSPQANTQPNPTVPTGGRGGDRPPRIGG